MKWLLPRVLVFAIGMVVLADAVTGQEPKTATEWLSWFAARWDDDSWQEGGRRPPYMRPLDDPGWQARMLAMQNIALLGRDAVEPLAQALRSDHTPTRVLAAQTLGYLAPDVPAAPLLDALKNDPDAAVRLYAVDSLGMQGGRSLREVLAARRSEEGNRDALRHIDYAIERGKNGVEGQVVDTLRKWKASSLNTAKLGKPAPGFQLATVSGTKVRLSDFRGLEAVVLVFVYGDT